MKKTTFVFAVLGLFALSSSSSLPAGSAQSPLPSMIEFNPALLAPNCPSCRKVTSPEFKPVLIAPTCATCDTKGKEKKIKKEKRVEFALR
jgi:hypothetical protein